MTDTIPTPEQATGHRYILSAALGLMALLWTPLALLVPYFSDLVRSAGIAGLIVLIIGQVALSLGAIILAHTLPDNWPGLLLGYGSLLTAAVLLLIGFTGGLLPSPFDTGQVVPLHCTQNTGTTQCTQQN